MIVRTVVGLARQEGLRPELKGAGIIKILLESPAFWNYPGANVLTKYQHGLILCDSS